MSAPQAELGPGAAALPAWRIYVIAREIEALAGIARECSRSGQTDTPRALAQFDRIRALLGGAEQGGE